MSTFVRLMRVTSEREEEERERESADEERDSESLGRDGEDRESLVIFRE